MSELTKEQVIQKILPYLKEYQNGFTLEIVPEGMRQVDDWWRVPVRPSSLPDRLYEYYEALAEIELDLDDKEDLNIVLMTSEPKEAAI